jgi:hypothetical protein
MKPNVVTSLALKYLCSGGGDRGAAFDGLTACCWKAKGHLYVKPDGDSDRCSVSYTSLGAWEGNQGPNPVASPWACVRPDTYMKVDSPNLVLPPKQGWCHFGAANVFFLGGSYLLQKTRKQRPPLNACYRDFSLTTDSSWATKPCAVGLYGVKPILAGRPEPEPLAPSQTPTVGANPSGVLPACRELQRSCRNGH